MTTPSKTLLAVAVGGLTLGSIVAHYGDDASPAALAAVLPLGAIASGMFLIVFMLEKEVAAYDQEQAMKGAPRCNTVPAPETDEIYRQRTTIQLKETAL